MKYVALFLGNNDALMLLRTAHSLDEFNSLLAMLPTLANCQDRKAASDALFIYLFKLRSAQSNEAIGKYFNFDHNTVARKIVLARNALLVDFAPKFVNYARSREDLLKHCSRLSRNLFAHNSNKLVPIWDATYIYVEKSLHHGYQKSTYNSHKKRNYIKPMMCVSTDGTIICTVGPFKATENDASIMKKILPQNIQAMKNFKKGDVMLVDRGFRDCVQIFMNQGYTVKSPSHANGNEQLSTLEANKTRLITRCRYDVERMNAVLKNTFGIFSVVQETYWIPTVMEDFTIAAL